MRLELPLNVLHQQRIMSAFWGTALPLDKSTLPVMGSGMRKCFSGMQLAEHQEDHPHALLSPEVTLLMQFSRSASHCAPETSGKITIAQWVGLGS